MKQFTKSTTLSDIIRDREEDIAEYNNLRLGKLDGRIRTAVRAAPSAFDDVLGGADPDGEGDIVVDATYVYTLINVAGTLKWDRYTHSTGW